MYEDQNRNSQENTQNNSYSSNRQYEYSFQSSNPQQGYSAGHAPNAQQPVQKRGSFAKFFLTILLCVAVSFAAGAGGAYYVYRNQSTDAQQQSGINPAPSKDSLHNSDPEGLLNRGDIEYSPYGSAGEDAYAISEVVRMVEDSVVVIQATVVTTDSWGQSTEGVGSGSGVIISDEGYILTCHHVVDGAKAVKVQLNTGGVYQAVLVGSDESSDLAVLKIEPIAEEPLTAAKHGKSGYLVVGERVVAIGNPLGTLGGTVTDGIISATERQISTAGGVMTLLQTNAAINSGNSGGGLFNLKGELIGIVNAKYAASGVEGLAFAIPIDSAYEVECDLIEYGYRRGIVDHGLSFVEVNDTNFRQYHYYYNIQENGLYVVSSKFNTDLKNKDRILSVNGIEILTEADFEAAIADCAVGETLTISYVRYTGTLSTTHQTTIVLQEYIPDRLVDFS